MVACSRHRSLAFVTSYPREEEVAHLSVLPSPVANSSHDSSNNRLTQLESSSRSEQHGSPTAGKEEELPGTSATGDELSGVHGLTGNTALGGGRSCVAPEGPGQAPSVDRGVGATVPKAGPVPPADRAVATDPLMMQAAASLRDGAKGEQVLSTPVCMAEQDIDLHHCQASICPMFIRSQGLFCASQWLICSIRLTPIGSIFRPATGYSYHASLLYFKWQGHDR